MSGSGRYLLRADICRKCRAAIYWVRTPAGKNMPVDVLPIPYKARAGAPGSSVTADGRVLRADLNVPRGEADGVGYISHFATCPAAREMRKTKRRKMDEKVPRG